MDKDVIEFKFDADRTIIIDKLVGSGASSVAYKCTVKFNNSDRTVNGILKEFVPESLNRDLLDENERYRYLPAKKEHFIEKYNYYKDAVTKVDNLLYEIAQNDSSIEWYYDSSSINDSSKNRIFELDEDNNRYRAMILLPYESTDASTTIKDFNIKGRIGALIKLCSVVEKFHANNLIIADLKPKNYLYATDGTTSRIKIIDFDSALLINDDAVIENQRITGSSFYSSPEIRSCDCSLYDMYAKRTDVYSIGAMLLNFVTINVFNQISEKYGWFKTMYLNQLSEHLNYDLFKKIRECDENITLGFWNKFVQIVLKATSSPENRYENMNEIQKDLISLQEIYENKGVHPEVMLNQAIEAAKNIDFNDIDEDLFTSIKEVDDEN